MRKVLHNITVAFFAIIVLGVILLVGLWYWLAPVNRDSPITLRGNYVYVDGDICMTDDDGSLHLVIPDDVCNYMYDENYVIAHQRPSFIRADYFWTFDKSIDSDSINKLKNKCYEIKDCYWIIRLRDNHIIGPLDKKEFEKKCAIMKVTIELYPSFEEP